MKEIKLTRGKVALVDDQDFDWLSQWDWHAHNNKRTKSFYAIRSISGVKTKMHRLILGLTDPKLFGEHRDGNGLNNQRGNLRIARNDQNAANSISEKTTQSGFKGVRPSGNKWIGIIMKSGVIIYLGTFESKIKAAEAYNTAALIFFGRFARLNKTLLPEP